MCVCRWLNEELYTSTGEDAFKLMQGQPELFQQYHEVQPQPNVQIYTTFFAESNPADLASAVPLTGECCIERARHGCDFTHTHLAIYNRH
jgi:hypothetical protein